MTYEPPPPEKRTGWQSHLKTSSSVLDDFHHSTPSPTTAIFSSPIPPPPSDSLEGSPRTQPKRRHNTSHTSQDVVTTDSIQPDWQAKLEAVKATVQRRANRRIVFRQEGDRLIPVGITSSRDPSGSAFLAGLEQHSQSAPGSGSQLSARRGLNTLSSLVGGSGHGSSNSTRRNRADPGYGVDLEELMIMEAMRLSLAEEEERKRKAVEEEEKLQRISQAISDACEPESQSLAACPDHQRSKSMNHLSIPSASSSSNHDAGSALITGSSRGTTSPIPIPGPSTTTMTPTSVSLKNPHSNPFLSCTPPVTRPTDDRGTRSASPFAPLRTLNPVSPVFKPENLSESPKEQALPPAFERSMSSSSSLMASKIRRPSEGMGIGEVYEDLGEYEPLVAVPRGVDEEIRQEEECSSNRRQQQPNEMMEGKGKASSHVQS